MTSALAGVLQLLKYEALETILHIEVARNSLVGDKADVDLVSRVVFLLNEVRGLMQKGCVLLQRLGRVEFANAHSRCQRNLADLACICVCRRTSSYVRCMTPAAVIIGS